MYSTRITTSGILGTLVLTEVTKAGGADHQDKLGLYRLCPRQGYTWYVCDWSMHKMNKEVIKICTA